MSIDASWTVTTEYATGVTHSRRVSRHGLAMAMQDSDMADPDVVRCEIECNVTGLVQGRAKPAAVRNWRSTR